MVSLSKNSPTKSEIDKLISDLKAMGFKVTQKQAKDAIEKYFPFIFDI